MTAVVEQSSVRPTTLAGRSTALVAVEHRGAREAAVRILRGLGATDVLAATTVEEARRAATGRPGDVGVVEAELADGSGTALARELRAAGWRRTVVLATDPDPFAVRAALAASVPCYLLVGVPAHRSANRPAGPAGPAGARPNGLTAIPSQPNGRTGPEQPASEQPAPDVPGYGLSQREIDVLQLVADGHSNRAVGEALGLSALTVKSHLARIARKLGTGDRAEMVIIALRAGLIG